MLTAERSYREVANLLDAVKQFFTHFDRYVHIPVIQNIEERVKTIRLTLTDQISEIFQKLAHVRVLQCVFAINLKVLPAHELH